MKPKKMRKPEVPTSFGEFKPVGHVVIAFETDEAAAEAREALLGQGFSQDGVLFYSASEMAQKLNATRGDTNWFASMGWEIRQTEEYVRLAKEGCGWLIVHAPRPEETHRVMEALKGRPVRTAEKYNPLIIEDLA